MMKYLFFILIIINSLVDLIMAQNERDVQYYMNLINDRIEKYSVGRGFRDASSYKPKTNRVFEFGEFDYIVIGAGSAGAVVASRLSENKESKVLLIEAGGQEDDFTDIPIYLTYLMNSEYAWDYKTVPQNTSCLGMVNNQCVNYRGRGLGGTTIVNGVHYIRGNRQNYDDWEKQGNPGWSYKDVLPLFLKSENANFNYTDRKYHRRGGLLNVEHTYPHKLEYYTFVQANLEMGLRVVDYNGAHQIGVAELQYNQIRGRRLSSNKAFLRPAYNRKNLKIMTYSYATKINIDESTKEAHGVTFSHGKKLYLARARREIIVSAGSYNSPQLLMLSGVGPPRELKAHGIPIIHPLPSVGSNLHDQFEFIALLFTSNVTNPPVSLEQQVRDYLQGFGDFTFTFNTESIAWVQTKLQNRPDVPDIEILLEVPHVSNDLFQSFWNYDNETFDSIFANVDLGSTFTLVPAIEQPKSRGKVKLNSSSPYEFPLIDTNSFSDLQQHDLETMYQGIKIIFDLINTEAFRRINANLVPNLTHPKCKNFKFNTRKYWYCQIKYLAAPLFHPVGTCKMGPDPMYGGAVVDHKLRVHGIKKLRVADASIMPSIVCGHMSAPAMMIGEKVSHLILNNKL